MFHLCDFFPDMFHLYAFFPEMLLFHSGKKFPEGDERSKKRSKRAPSMTMFFWHFQHCQLLIEFCTVFKIHNFQTTHVSLIAPYSQTVAPFNDYNVNTIKNRHTTAGERNLHKKNTASFGTYILFHCIYFLA